MYVTFATLLSCHSSDEQKQLTPPDEIGILPAIVATGEVSWNLEYDENAQNQGYESCSYTRRFEGTEVLDMDYLCPQCDFLVVGQATFSNGLDCYLAFNPQGTAQRVEQWGWNSEIFYRSTKEQTRLGDLSQIENTDAEQPIALEWSSDYSLIGGGIVTISAAGEFTYKVDENILLPDPFPTRTEPYLCGWPQNDPKNLEIDYDLQIGNTFPNVRLEDQCHDKLALWDLYGYWLVIEASQPDCGPCQVMASEATSWINDMRSRGIPIMVISLLGKSMAESNLSPSDELQSLWVSEFNLEDPVLKDRGFARALFPALIEQVSGNTFGYPAWVVVDPQLTIVDGGTGFSSWNTIEQIIMANL